VLAVDLSLASLSYAKRKTRELGLSNIEYAQADILRIGSIRRDFDVIESGGVLHHLDDPFAGWRELISLLRPGGVMCVGLYSTIGRARLAAARTFIAERGYRPIADDIRRFRQEVVTSELEPQLRNFLRSTDFFNMSGCRDLFFHAQEHRLDLLQIQSFINDHDLELLGFVLEPQATQRFLRRFPNERNATNLDLWHTFEMEHPDFFTGMYNFWIQKRWSAIR
jgi:SAM-dependent methyltransferase